MTMQYTYAANHLPEAKMRIYPTKVINIIGGPGSVASWRNGRLSLVQAQSMRATRMARSDRGRRDAGRRAAPGCARSQEVIRHVGSA